MRLLGLSLLLAGVPLTSGCFEDPPNSTSGGSTADPSSGTGTNPGSTTDLSTSSDTSGATLDETTFGTTLDTLGTSPGTGTGTGASDELLRLFPLTCTEAATWNAAVGMLECTNDPPPAGAFVQVSNKYELGQQPLERVIVARPNILTQAPLDGIFEIDTSGFSNPVLRSEVACSTDDGCEINYSITAEFGDQVVPGGGDVVVFGNGPAEVAFDLPSEPNLRIRLNLNSPAASGEGAFLWIDPRVVDEL